MNALVISDRDSKTGLSEDLKAGIVRMLDQKGHAVEAVELGRDDSAPCLGCLLCLTKHPGECVSKDVVAGIIGRVKRYDLTIYVTPVLFGGPSSSVKNAMDRGTGSHNWQIIVGYGGDVDDEERSTFVDLIAKHRGAADVVHPGMDRQVDVFVTGSTAENTAICDVLRKTM